MEEIVNIIIVLINVYQIILILRVLLSWLRIDPYSNPFAQLLLTLTEPLLAPIRAVLPPVGMMDLSPLVLLVLLSVLQQIIRLIPSMF